MGATSSLCCGTSDRYQPYEDGPRRPNYNRNQQQQQRREIGQPGSRTFGGGVVGSGAEWNCTVCTLRNASGAKHCSACGCARGSTNVTVGQAQSSHSSSPYSEVLTEEEKEERRLKALAAAEERSKSFKQGGGGEKLKAKAKALEEAEKRNRELGGPSPHMRWQTNL